MIQKPTRGILPCSAYTLRYFGMRWKPTRGFFLVRHTHWDEILRPPTRGFFLVRWRLWWWDILTFGNRWRPPTRGFFLVRCRLWWWEIHWRFYGWYFTFHDEDDDDKESIETKITRWFRYDILVRYRLRLKDDDHVMRWVHGNDYMNMSIWMRSDN